MRTSLLIFSILIVFSSVVFGNGETDPSPTEVTVTREGSTVKVYCKSASKSVKVSIITSKGRIVFSEVVKIPNGFIRPYDVTDLKQGKYFVTVEDQFGKTEKSIKIEK